MVKTSSLRPPVVRKLSRDDPDFAAAIHCALNVQLPAIPGKPDRCVTDFLGDTERQGTDADLLFGAFDHQRLSAACVAPCSPGGSALVLVGTSDARERSLRGVEAVLRALQPAAASRSLRLLQLLLSPESRDVATSVQAAGFRYLTRLIYLQRRVGAPSFSEKRVGDPPANEISPPPFASRRMGHPQTGDDPELRWESYTPAREVLFQDAVARTYAQSQDCPELTGVRPMSDVLAGHRTAGVYDPRLWFVALRGAQPVGVLLLNRIPRRRALEIVYMGVAQVARGTGVANALLHRAVETAALQSATNLALAVDARNTPARRLYQRWDFTPTGERDAWITTPFAKGTCDDPAP